MYYNAPMKKWLYIAPVLALIVGVIYLANYEVKSAEIAPTQATEQVKPVVTVSLLDADILFTMINDERAKAGVKPLVRDTRLDTTAQSRADDMVARHYFSHRDPVTDENMVDILKSQSQCTYASENIISSGTTDRNAAAIEWWLNSPAHKKAMLDPDYETTGFGINGDIGVQHFCDLD
jgi:uncharacterized protein YkwD